MRKTQGSKWSRVNLTYLSCGENTIGCKDYGRPTALNHSAQRKKRKPESSCAQHQPPLNQLVVFEHWPFIVLANLIQPRKKTTIQICICIGASFCNVINWLVNLVMMNNLTLIFMTLLYGRSAPVRWTTCLTTALNWSWERRRNHKLITNLNFLQQ